MMPPRAANREEDPAFAHGDGLMSTSASDSESDAVSEGDGHHQHQQLQGDDNEEEGGGLEEHEDFAPGRNGGSIGNGGQGRAAGIEEEEEEEEEEEDDDDDDRRRGYGRIRRVVAPPPNTARNCAGFPLSVSCCGYMRVAFMLAAIVQIIIIRGLHDTYVIGGVNKNKYELPTLVMEKTCSYEGVPGEDCSKVAGVSPIDSALFPKLLLNKAEDLRGAKSDQKVTPPLTCLGATISSYSDINAHSLAADDVLFIRVSSDDVNYFKPLNLTLGPNATETSLNLFHETLPRFDYVYSRNYATLEIPDAILVEKFAMWELQISRGCLATGWRKWNLLGKGNGFAFDGGNSGGGGGRALILDLFGGWNTVMFNQILFGMRREMPQPPPKPAAADHSDDAPDEAAKGSTSLYEQLLLNWLTGKGNTHLSTNGYLWHLKSTERWSYDGKSNISAISGNSFVAGLFIKVSYALLGVLAFFCFSSSTAVIVRVLTTCGVVITFPLLDCLRRFGLATNANFQLLSLSYPWLGTPIRVWRESRHHARYGVYLLFPHFVRFVVYYTMFSLGQSPISYLVYNKSVPQYMPVYVWGIFMIWEYFGMLVLRGVEGIDFFPKFCMLSFVCFHVYVKSYCYGFTDLCLWPLFFSSASAMIFTFVSLELPKYQKGILCEDHPRECWNGLAWGDWSGSLPPDWTVFMSLNQRYVPVGSDGELDDVDEDEGDSDDGRSVDLEHGGRSPTPIVEDMEVPEIIGVGSGSTDGTTSRRRVS